MKCLYVAIYWDTQDDKDVYWFTGDSTKDENDQFIKAYHKENGHLGENIDYDSIVSVYQVANDEIEDIYVSNHETKIVNIPNEVGQDRYYQVAVIKEEK